ncbi:hypothetical protein B0H11DRAFT_1903738 [Mycena galericulata]|nr:hypothetical protein B0H11DRAFT_1903738 [Mycena galericulata]
MSEMPGLGPGRSMGARCCRREREKRNTSEMTLSQPFEPLEPLIMFRTIRAQLLIDDAESVPTEIKYIRCSSVRARAVRRARRGPSCRFYGFRATGSRPVPSGSSTAFLTAVPAKNGRQRVDGSGKHAMHGQMRCISLSHGMFHAQAPSTERRAALALSTKLLEKLF